MVINVNDYSHFIVTGRYYQSERKFRQQYSRDNWRTAMGINLWNGRVWAVHALTKKRVLVKRVVN